VPRIISKLERVEMSLDTARKSDVVEKVFAHRSSKKASAFSCPTRDRIDAVDHFISPKVGPKSLLWDFFNNVKSACATSLANPPKIFASFSNPTPFIEC